MSCMFTVQDVFEITYIEQNLGKPYPGLDQLRAHLVKLYDYKIFDSNIFSLKHEKGSLPPLRCFLDTLSRAIESIKYTSGDEIEKRIMLIETENYYKWVERLIKTIEQEEIGYSGFRRGTRQAGITCHMKIEKD